MYATIAILSALQYRCVSGKGQYTDMALLDCIVALGGNQMTGFFVTGKPPGRYGNAHASLVPYQVFTVADGEIVVAVGNDGQWQAYCAAIERTDQRLSTGVRRPAGSAPQAACRPAAT